MKNRMNSLCLSFQLLGSLPLIISFILTSVSDVIKVSRSASSSEVFPWLSCGGSCGNLLLFFLLLQGSVASGAYASAGSGGGAEGGAAAAALH